MTRDGAVATLPAQGILRGEQMRTTIWIVLVALSAWSLGCEKKADTVAPTDEPGAEPVKHEDEHAHEAEGKDGPKTLADLPPGTNAVQNEMRLLNTAMQNTLTLIANNQLDGVQAQILTVHPARELTAKALEQGAYKPPKNPDKLDEFVKTDEEFHDKLVVLLKASKANDLPAATTAYTDLVQGCTSCHQTFRF